MFAVGDAFRFYSSVYVVRHHCELASTLKWVSRTRASAVCTFASVLSSILCKCRRLVLAKAFFICAGDFVYRAFHKGFLESTCKESHAHGSFRYFSVFIGPTTSCPWWACIGNLYEADTVWHTAGPIRVAVTGPKLLQILAESAGGQKWPSACIPRWSHYPLILGRYTFAFTGPIEGAIR